MTITPFVDVKSEDILSAHISGIQHAVNKIETILNMKTTSATGHVLLAVTDQEDATLHNFIYEGTIRNWLANPVIKRNGTVVPSSEYTISPAHGVVVFKEQQNANDVITADISYVDSQSVASDKINLIDSLPKQFYTGTLIPKTTYITNFKDLGIVPAAAPATGVQQAPSTIDCYPIFVPSPMTFDKLKFIANKATVTGSVILGVYSNKNTYPDQLLGQTISFSVAAGDTINPATYEQPLTQDLVLAPGMYWLARWQSAGITLDGVSVANPSQVIEILDPEDATLINVNGGTKCFGTRANATVTTTLPTTYPALTSGGGSNAGQYLKRSTMAPIYIKRKA